MPPLPVRKGLPHLTLGGSVWHRSAKTLYYHGLGRSSTRTQYTFAEDDTGIGING